MRKTKLLILFTFLFLGSILAQNFPLAFRKINSGTKSNIRKLEIDLDGNFYFLTDYIYKLKGDHWERLEFPVAGKIATFSPVANDDLWFSVNLVTNTSLLYHHHHAITENISSPFSNHITAMCFSSDKSGFLASYADIVTYGSKGQFSRLSPAPVRFVIEKLAQTDDPTLWGLTNSGEFFSFQKSRYERILNEHRVKAFVLRNSKMGFFVTQTELFRLDQSGIHSLCRDARFDSLLSMILLKDGSILMAGKKGKLALFHDGKLEWLPPVCTDNLNEMILSASGDIWICGDNGTLLYSGTKVFPYYHEDRRGFSSRKLIKYGINTDDEYGVAMEDFDGDGKVDIYSVRIYEQNRFYLNRFDPHTSHLVTTGFVEEAFRRNTTGSLQPGFGNAENELKLGVCAADIENDGDQDLYLCYLNSNNKLLLNNGKGFFRNVSTQEKRACENYARSNAAAFADVDLDGDLDLFITNEDGSNRMFENDGTGHFRDVTESSGLATTGGGMCASFADVNEDGYPDLAVSFWYFPNRIYLNKSRGGRISFMDFSASTDLSKADPVKSNAVAFADVNNDGHMDLFIGNRDHGNRLYLNNGKGAFKDRTHDYFAPENYMTNGAVFADFDLDGYLDLYLSNVGENVLYKNIEGRRFEEMTSEFGAELDGYCTGSAVGDIDNDGDPDLYVANYIQGDSKLFINNSGSPNFVTLDLQGVQSNRDAAGTKVWLYQQQEGDSLAILAGYREVHTGDGYGSSSAKKVIFGVKPEFVYFALIKFPSTPDTLRIEHVQAGSRLSISEVSGIHAFRTNFIKAVIRFFTDSEIQPEIIKYLLIVSLLVFYTIRRRTFHRKIRLIQGLGSFIVFLVFILVNSILLYQWPQFLYFVAPITFVFLLITLHLFIDRILLRNLAQKEKLELREKISRDLHDDLASTLGSISIYAGTLKEDQVIQLNQGENLANKISTLSERAVQSISDIIWMTSPRNDSLQSLFSKAQNNMLELFTDNGIRFNAEIELPEKPVVLPDGLRNNIFLILKEATHNIIRHSKAKNVQFKVTCEHKTCTVSLVDDGVGIPKQEGNPAISHGNGLINMRKRATESSMELSIISNANQGTKIVLVFGL